MGLGVSLFLFAVGAVLAWAVETEAQGIDLNAVGVILMIVAAVGLIISFLFWGQFGSYGFGRREERRYYRHGPGHIHEEEYHERDVM